MCQVKACPYPGAGLCSGHRLRLEDPAPFTRPAAVVDLGEPERGEPDTAERFRPPKAETALEEWARRLAERKREPTTPGHPPRGTP